MSEVDRTNQLQQSAKKGKEALNDDGATKLFKHEELVGIKVPSQVAEDPNKVAMFFNAFSAPNKNGAAPSIYTTLPKEGIAQLHNRDPLVSISGPSNEQEQTYRKVACAQTISTYPHVSPDRKEGDPICDRYFLRLYDNRAIFAVADGCNWGPKPREAAMKATAAFVDYIEARQHELTEIPETGHFILRAFSAAHEKIIEGKENVWDAGTTTMLGGMIVELEGGQGRWALICGSVGDCKAFHYSQKKDLITDVTELNRLMANSTDQRDPGGRLGPYVDQGHPDLRNLALFNLAIEEGDTLVVVSDGVHDNFDPALIGLMPNMISDSPCSKWEDMNPMEGEKLRSRWRNAILGKLALETDSDPKSIVMNMTEHCMRVTKTSRDYMEQRFRDNAAGKKTPLQTFKYPGKMDHSTVLCFRLMRYEKLKYEI